MLNLKVCVMLIIPPGDGSIKLFQKSLHHSLQVVQALAQNVDGGRPYYPKGRVKFSRSSQCI